MFKSLLAGLNHLIFPNNCLLCKTHLRDNSSDALCKKCLVTIESNRPPFCKMCSRSLNGDLSANVCPRCSETEYFFDRALAATVYNDTMKNLIHLFKYRQKLMLHKTFTQLISDFLDQYSIDIGSFDTIMPVPLHSSRLRERGYNQSQLITSDLADTFNIKESRGNLIRIRPTKNQAFLKKKERWTNIRSAFKIINPSQLKRRSVVLVDDLFTTGATVSEAARTLKGAGAREVTVLTLSIAY